MNIEFIVVEKTLPKEYIENLYDVFELQEDCDLGDGKVARKGKRGIRLIGVEKLKSYIDNGFNINAKDPEGNTELHRAADDNLFNKVKLLCEAGADVNIKNNKGLRPIDIVSLKKEYFIPCGIIKILLRYGAVDDSIP